MKNVIVIAKCIADCRHHHHDHYDQKDNQASVVWISLAITSCQHCHIQVAVHCHAGLGRTGVLLACYLVYYLRFLFYFLYLYSRYGFSFSK